MGIYHWRKEIEEEEERESERGDAEETIPERQEDFYRDYVYYRDHYASIGQDAMDATEVLLAILVKIHERCDSLLKNMEHKTRETTSDRKLLETFMADCERACEEALKKDPTGPIFRELYSRGNLADDQMTGLLMLISTRYCPDYGSKIRPPDRFCQDCGSK